MKSKKILLLNGQDTCYWFKSLDETISALDGILKTINAANIQSIIWHDYDLIILDAGIFQDLSSTISQIRMQDPKAQIVVFSATPTWKQAREVILAGAADYSRKSLDKEHILFTIARSLTRKTYPGDVKCRNKRR